MHAFTMPFPSHALSSASPSRPLAHPHPHTPRMTLARRPRPSKTTSSPPPPSPPPSLTPPSDTDELAHLKGRSLLALRGLSDLGTAAVLHELSTRAMLGAGLSAAAAAGADSQLLLGGLMGVWTAAAFADRKRRHTTALVREAEQMPARWDSAFIHRPEVGSDDARDAVAWLHALGELEGPDAAALLRSLAAADSPPARAALASALAEFPTRSNAAMAALHLLADDSDSGVRDAAHDAVEACRRAGVLALPAQPPAFAQQCMADVLDRLFEEELPVVAGAGAPQDGTRWIFDAVARRVEQMGSVALSQPDVMAVRAALPMGDVHDVPAREVRAVRLQVPLFDGLKWSEVHGLAALALLPAAYELFSMVDGGDLPLRFVGLGWLLTVGGLAGYPKSGSLWRRFTKSLDRFSPR